MAPPKNINKKNVDVSASTFNNNNSDTEDSSYYDDDDDYYNNNSSTDDDDENCININIYNKNNNQKSDSLRTTFIDIFIMLTIFATIGYIISFL